MIIGFDSLKIVATIGPVLVFSSLGITATAMNSSIILYLSSIEPLGLLILFGTKLMPYLQIVIAFTFIKFFMPNPFADIIMLSANTETHQIKNDRDAGTTEYLAKPVFAKRFYERIVAVIENKRRFVRVKTFFGSDRRRLNRPYFDEERRVKNRAYSAN